MSQLCRYLLMIGLGALISGQAFSLPKFSIRTGAKCQTCHVNPTGKGMRNEFGRSYGADELPFPTWRETTNLEEFSVKLSPNISVGMDVRTLFFADQKSGKSSGIQMQGDLYFDLRLNKNVRLYYDRGLYTGFELFALAKGLPLDGYVKAGKFMPSYGTRTDDHNAFIRGGPYGGGPFSAQFAAFNANGTPTGLRFGERSEDTGIELGISPGMFTVQVGVFNGSPGAGLSGITPTSSKSVAARGDATVKLDFMNLNVGGSFYQTPVGSDKHTFTGVFGAISFDERYSLNGEVDIVKVNRAGTSQSGLMVWNELNVVVVEGVDLKLGYEFYDPDVDTKSGGFTRVLVGAEFFVLSGVELRPMYRINLEEPTEVSNNELQFMLHFYF